MVYRSSVVECVVCMRVLAQNLPKTSHTARQYGRSWGRFCVNSFAGARFCPRLDEVVIDGSRDTGLWFDGP